MLPAGRVRPAAGHTVRGHRASGQPHIISLQVWAPCRAPTRAPLTPRPLHGHLSPHLSALAIFWSPAEPSMSEELGRTGDFR